MNSNKPAEMGRTEAFAAIFNVTAETVRHALCTRGHYCGLRPIKAQNRFLYWNLDDARRVVAGESATAQQPKTIPSKTAATSA